jgi:RNA polymerase-binding transcription factor DksA
VDASQPAAAPVAEEPGSQVEVERARLDATVDNLEARVADVEAALGRLERGTYGSCEICGETIDEVILIEDPTHRRCAEHGPP